MGPFAPRVWLPLAPVYVACSVYVPALSSVPIPRAVTVLMLPDVAVVLCAVKMSSLPSALPAR